MDCLHQINSNISSFLPPIDQLPEFKLDAQKLQADINIVDFILQDIKEEDLDRVAIEQDDHKISYRQLISNTNSLANAFLSLGLKHGDRLFVFLPFIHELFAPVLGAIKAGGIPAVKPPVPNDLAIILLKEIKPSFVLIDAESTIVNTVLDNSSASVILVNKKSDVKLEPNDRILFLEDLLSYPSTFDKVLTKGASAALISFTSGSSGIPKGCIGLHASYAAAMNTKTFLPTGVIHIVLNTSGWSLLSAFGVFRSGAKVLLSKERSVGAILQNLHKNVTVVMSIPPIYNQLILAIKKDPETWKKISGYMKVCISGGEHVDANFIKKWEQTSGKKMLNGYGTTEVMHSFATSFDMPAGSVGRANPIGVCEILDKNLNPVPVGTTGYIAIKGVGGCMYWGNNEKQSYFVRNDIPGDLAVKDENGFFWYLGREDDMLAVIVKSGGNVSAIELEGILRSDSRVYEVAVVGKKSTEERADGKLTLVKAFVVTKEPEVNHGQLEEDLMKLVVSKTDRHLDEVEFVDSLPVLASGKVNRKALREATKYPSITLVVS